jgi:hypothetical protein
MCEILKATMSDNSSKRKPNKTDAGSIENLIIPQKLSKNRPSYLCVFIYFVEMVDAE